MFTIKRIFHFLFLFVCTTAIWAQSLTYSVQQGETLYSIATKHGVTVDQILVANAGVSAETLKAGATLIIPQQKTQSGIANSNCREMHRVKKGETIYGISAKYGITEAQLLKANPEIKSSNGVLIKKGMFLCIPFPEASTITPAIKKQDVHISVFLPLKEQNEVGQRCVEFYRGFIAAAEELVDEGYNIFINVVDEPTGNSDIAEQLGTITGQTPDFVVGPLYPSHFEAISAFAKDKDVRIIVPFSSKVLQVEQNKNLFLVNAPESYKALYSAQLIKKLFSNAHLVFVSSASVGNTTFMQQLKEQADAQKISFSEFTPSKILVEWKAQLKSGRKNLLFTDANKLNDLQQIADMVVQLKKTYPTYDISLIAGADALQQTANLEGLFFMADTYFLTPSYFNTYHPKSQQFAADYKAQYNTTLLPLAPSMAALGYDLSYQAIKQTSHYGKDYTTQVLSTQPYQTLLQFRPTKEKGGFVNGNMLLIHYKQEGTIDQISL